MTPDRFKEIKETYQMVKSENGSVYHPFLGDCIDEIERLKGWLEKIRDRHLGDPEDYWEMARKALDNNQGTKPIT